MADVLQKIRRRPLYGTRFYGLIAIGALIATAISGSEKSDAPNESRPPLSGETVSVMECADQVTVRLGDEGDDADEMYSVALWLKLLVHQNQNAQYDRFIQRRAAYLRQAQWDESKQIAVTDPRYGGTGRRATATPDLFHTAIAVEALREAGVPADDRYMQKAVVFLSRCQNQRDTSTELPGSVDGGFGAAPVKKPPEYRSSGDLTCLAMKALLDAGVPKDDDRIQSALVWLQTHYTLDANPGKSDPQDGLFLYYHALGQAMRGLQQDRLIDADGLAHDWRHELAEVLIQRQQPDGSWISLANSTESLQSGSVAATFYAVLTLNQIRTDSTFNKIHPPGSWNKQVHATPTKEDRLIKLGN